MTNKAKVGQPKKPLTLVVIGASAGGLEAISRLISTLPENTPFAYLIAQHLSPYHNSILPSILQRLTSLKVVKAQNDECIEAGKIYVAPEANNIEVNQEHRIILTPCHRSDLDGSPCPSIDLLLTTVSTHFKEHCIGIILSGTGHDGEKGMQAIHDKGGYCIVQEPKTAKFNGMPEASIHGCPVDAVLAPEKICEELALIDKYTIQKMVSHNEQNQQTETDVDTILEVLFKYKGVDFSNYKEKTINRRIERRMIHTDKVSLKSYLDYLQATPQEVAMLYEDILIGVTQFFRDEDAYKSFSNAMEEYLIQHPRKEELRVWIPGCSTGEEVYSILVIIKELLEKHERSISIKVFATDINNRSLDFARKGVYSKKVLSSFDETLMDKYFTQQDGVFIIKSSLRESVVFAFQNLLADPPFNELDLIVCRNLLIYFKVEAQNRIIPMFHRSLKPNGLLFLGKSENSAYYDDWFKDVDAKNKIFQHIVSAKANEAYPMPKKPKKRSYTSESEVQPAKTPMTLNDVVLTELSDLILTELIVTNLKMEVLYKRGKLDYLKMPDGYTSFNLYKMVNPNLSMDIRQAVLQVKETHQKASTKFVVLGESHQAKRMVKADVIPLRFNNEEMYAISFQKVDIKDLSTLDGISDSQGLDNQSILSIELSNTKQNMQILVNELESSNDQYQALNEELQSSNEEFQSTNEELETSIEELQSTNEELQTAYIELKEQYNQKNIAQKSLKILNGRYDSLLENINDGVVTASIDGDFIRVNKAMEVITGYSKRTLLSKNWVDLVEGMDSEAFLERYQNLIETGKTTPITVELKTKKKELRTLVLEDYITRDKDGIIQVWTFANDVTDELLAKEVAKLSQKKYQLTFEQANIGIAHVSLSGEWLKVNPALCNTLGYSEQELMSKTFQDITYPDDLDKDLALVSKMLSGEIKEYKLDKRYLQKSGDVVWCNLSVGLVRDLDAKPLYFVSTIEDVTESRLNSIKLEQAYVVFNSIQEAIVITDLNFDITRVNASFREMTGYEEGEIIGQNVGVLVSKQQTKSFQGQLISALEEKGKWAGEVVSQTKNGDAFSVYLTFNMVTNNDNNVVEYVGVLTDISTLKEAQAQTTYLAYHDTLTGLPNRALCLERLNQSIIHAKRNQNDFALFFIDLDRFKVINDGLGHSIGDKVLIETAQRLKSVMREEDSLARLGGDEFVAIVDGLDSPMAASKVAEKLIEAISKPFHIDKNKINAGVSVGISIYPDDGGDFESLLVKADLAMYLAKEQGRNTYRFASEDLSNEAFEKVTLEHAIQDALDKKEFEVFYQPIVNFKNKQVSTLEALIRWNHPRLGLVPPNKFIPIAEESNLIVQISSFVLRAVINDLETLKTVANYDGKVAINLSVREFESHEFFALLMQLCKEDPSLAENIQFEITERLIMPEGEALKRKLEKIQGLGFKFIVDDFGTGYSNLKYLRSMSPEALKIDMCFVKEIGFEDDTSEEIIKATIAMAKALKLKVTAEGVETPEQFEFLKKQGCLTGQGYLFSRPQNIKRTVNFLKNQK